MGTTDAFLAELRDDLREAAIRTSGSPRAHVWTGLRRPHRPIVVCLTVAAAALAAAGVVYAVTHVGSHVHRVPPGAIAPTSRPDLMPVARGTAPDEIVRQILDRLGDRSLILSGRVGPPPARAGTRGVWLTLNVATNPNPPHLATADPRRVVEMEWEAHLIASAARDEIWVADSQHLKGWQERGPGSAPYVPEYGLWLSGQGEQLAGWFAAPALPELRSHLHQLARRDGFTVISVDALHPLQIAPRVIVHATSARQFMRIVGRLLTTPGLFIGGRYQLPRPLARREHSTGAFPLPLYEGWSFEARDDHGPFLLLTANMRGDQEEHVWARPGLTFDWTTG